MAKLLFFAVVALTISAASAGRDLLQAPSPAPTASETVTQVAQATPALSTLVEALTKTGLAATLNDPNLVATVFAPTNDAFTVLAKNLGYTMNQLLNSSILKPTLLYHVVPGVAAQSSSLANGQVLTTNLPGQNLTVYINGKTVTISGVQTSANVTKADTPASKAIIHVVNQVLLPAQSALNGAPAPAPMMMMSGGAAMAPSMAPMGMTMAPMAMNMAPMAMNMAPMGMNMANAPMMG